MNEVVACEISLCSDLSNTEAILLSTAGSVIVLCLLAIIPVLFFVENRIKILWEQINKISEEDVVNFKSVYTSRLEQVHYITDTLDPIEIKLKNESSSFNYVRRYIYRIGMFLLIGCIYLVISNWIFENYLNVRPQLLSYLIYSRLYLSEMDYWSKEVVTNNALDLRAFYPNYIPSSIDYDKELDNSVANVLQMVHNLTYSEYKVLIGDEIYSSLFNNDSSNISMLANGLYSSVTTIVLEAYNLAYKSLLDPDIGPVYIAYYDSLGFIGQKFEDTFQNVISHSKIVIEGLLNDYIIFSVFFCIVFVIYYLCLYKLFLSKEEEIIISLTEISKIIISINSYKKWKEPTISISEISR